MNVWRLILWEGGVNKIILHMTNEYIPHRVVCNTTSWFLKFPRDNSTQLIFTYDALVPGQFWVRFMIFWVGSCIVRLVQINNEWFHMLRVLVNAIFLFGYVILNFRLRHSYFPGDFNIQQVLINYYAIIW
jgi:hypothetical protein